MALRKGVFTSSVFLTAKLGGADRYARIGSYHICNGIVPGETFVSSVQNLDRMEKFDRGYRISGSGKWFQLPESRLRIEIDSLFKDGRLNSEVNRRSVCPRVTMETLQLRSDSDGFTAMIGDITSCDDMNSFGGMEVTQQKFEKSKKKSGSRPNQNGGDKNKNKSKGNSNGNPKSDTSSDKTTIHKGRHKSPIVKRSIAKCSFYHS